MGPQDFQFKKFVGKYSLDGKCDDTFLEFKHNTSMLNSIVDHGEDEITNKDVLNIQYFETLSITNNKYITNVYRFEFINGAYTDIQLIIPNQLRKINEFDDGKLVIKNGIVRGNINLSSPILKKCS